MRECEFTVERFLKDEEKNGCLWVLWGVRVIAKNLLVFECALVAEVALSVLSPPTAVPGWRLRYHGAVFLMPEMTPRTESTVTSKKMTTHNSFVIFWRCLVVSKRIMMTWCTSVHR